MDTDSRLAMGGNNPPDNLELGRAAEIITTANQWLADVPEITDTAAATAAQEHVEKLRASKKDLAAAQKGELAPIEAAAAEVKTKYRGPLESLEAALKKLLELSGAWIVRERNRVAAEKAAQEAEARRLREEAARLERERLEAERKAEEERRQAEEAGAPDTSGTALEAERDEASEAAAAAAAAARSAEKAAARRVEPVTIKSAAAPRAMTLRAYWRAEVTDEAEAIKSFEAHPDVRRACLEAALKLANERARATKDEAAAPPGFRFIKEERAA